jgi:hypothetical protein
LRAGERDSRELTCPFCRSGLDRPIEISISAAETALGGKCKSCGALYIADLTGKNVGTVMIQALELLGRELSKDISNLVLGLDYDDMILSYNWRLHRSAGEASVFGDGYGRLYIVKARNE